MKQEKIQSIDSIRGIACIIVIISHVIFFDQQIGIYANGCGKIGVTCFLIMSGFLSFLPYVSSDKDCNNISINFVLKYY